MKAKDVFSWSYKLQKTNHLVKVNEELAELSKEICDVMIGRKELDDKAVLEEIADVQFVLNSITSLLSEQKKKEIADRVEMKVEKREKRVRKLGASDTKNTISLDEGCGYQVLYNHYRNVKAVGHSLGQSYSTVLRKFKEFKVKT